MSKRELTQQEIDAVFRSAGEVDQEALPAVAKFDFGRLDRIPKSQVRALQLMHEDFARNVSSGLSAYLRSFVSLSLVSIEQISSAEFLGGLSAPACIAYLGLQPYDDTAVLEMSNEVMFALIELLLGSKGRIGPAIQRKITEIEKNLAQTLLRVILRDLSESWKTVADISFSVQSLSSEPQLLHVFPPTEAVVVIAIEIRVGSCAGLMNLAIPSLFIKRLRNRFDQLRQVRSVETTEQNQRRLGRLIQDTSVRFEARIHGGPISTRTLLNLEVGDVLVLDYPAGRPVTGLINGREKYRGELAARSDMLIFQVEGRIPAEPNALIPAATAGK